jgi:hypothetical protein
MAICFGYKKGEPYLTDGATGVKYKILSGCHGEYFVDVDNKEIVYKINDKSYRQTFIVTHDCITLSEPKEIECTSYELFYGA